MKDVLAQVSDFDIRLLRVFRSVVENGGFSAAESSLGIARSAISQQMSSLEQRLGLRLCSRGRSGFALTDEGRAVYAAILRLAGALEAFRCEVNALHHDLRGTLEIGITDNLVSIPHMKITKALALLKDRGQSIQINIHMTGPKEVEQGVLDGSLHVGVIPQSTILPALNYQNLYTEQSGLYCGLGHPLFDNAHQIIDENNLVTYETVIPSFKLPSNIVNLYQKLNCTASASDREGMLFLILTGRYIGYLPNHYAKSWLKQNKLRQINSNTCKYELNMACITSKGRNPHLVLAYFLEVLTKQT